MASTWNPAKAYQFFSSTQLNTAGGQAPLIGEAPDNANTSLTIYNGILQVGGQAVSKFAGMAVKLVNGANYNPNGVDYFTRGGGQTYGGNTFDQAFATDEIFGFVYFDRKKPYLPVSQMKSTYRMLDVVGFLGRINLQAYTDIAAGDKLCLVDALDSNNNKVTAVKKITNPATEKQIGIALSPAVANGPVYVLVKF